MSSRRFVQALLALILISAGSVCAWAEGKTYAVIIGVGHYQDNQIQSRTWLDQDAASLYSQLTSGANAKIFSKDNTRLLVSDVKKAGDVPAQVANRENVLNAFKWVTSSAKEDDRVLIYWAGSGAPLDKATCYFTSDSTVAQRNKNAISAAEIEAMVDQFKTGKVAIFLNVNFKGYAAGPEKVQEDGLDNRFLEFSGGKKAGAARPDDDDEMENALKGRVVLSCTSGLVAAPQIQGKDVFYTILSEAFSGKADKEGDDTDGQITIDEVTKYFQDEYLKRINVTETIGLFPVALGKSLHFTIALNAPGLEKAIERSREFAEKAKQDNLEEAIVKDGKSFIEHMPKQDSERKLRKTFLGFTEGKVSSSDLVKAYSDMQAELKISQESAEKFADSVLRVMRYARDAYVKPVKLNELAVNAVKGLYRWADEKIPDEMKHKLEKFDSTSESDIKNLLVEARMALGNKDAIKNEKGLDRTLKYMLTMLDRHTVWFNQDELEEINRGMKEFIGVGIQIRKEFQRDVVKVATPILNSPAYRAQIKAGDLILKIINEFDPEGNPLPQPVTTETKGLTTQDVVKKILGQRGTKVTLVIEREEADGPKVFNVDLVRNRIEGETVFGVHRLADDTWDYYLDKDRKIVYVRLSQFAGKTARDLKNVLQTYQKKGMNGLILDLRFNPGGLLDAAKEICDMFVDDGVIVSVKPRNTSYSNEIKTSTRGFKILDVPLVVLVNGGSASASEIVSACIQDHERGIVMGERSFGKGSVQQIRPMDLNGHAGAIKMTMAAFYGPSGKNLNRFPNSKDEDDWGVKPPKEYTIKLSPTERAELDESLTKNELIPRRDAPRMETKKTFIDRQLDAAVELLKKQTAHTGQR
ncbi:MAG: S41 family peptidase [Planctomycetia bacterium]|nr:S41 family peptidase [Planctomycetia bacterium]